MKYEAEIDEQQIEVEITQRDGRISARVDGGDYEAEVASAENGVYLIFVGDRVFEARVSSHAGSLHVTVRGRLFDVTILDRRNRRPGVETVADGQEYLTAPMPGKVVRVLLNPGDPVGQGQGVVVVEAMKMQNEIKASRAGRILEIRVTAGEAVESNQLLAILE